MQSHKINELNNFIAGWYIAPQVCKDLIDFFETSENKQKGKTGSGVDITKKVSTDLVIDVNRKDKPILNYYRELEKVLAEYTKTYPLAQQMHRSFGLTEEWNIQKYNPKEGYFAKHFERNGSNFFNMARHLVFMTYLNDVNDGGETEFVLQKLKVKPETGLTLIWGSDWTFTHRGITSPTELNI